MSGSYERVYTVTDYWDGPIGGVADYNGAPHRYQAEFDRGADEYSSVFQLKPVSQEVLALLLEDSAIFQRWWRAFREGAVLRDTHPALPNDRGRHEKIVVRIAELEKADARWPVRVRGAFRLLPEQATTGGSPRSFEVRWDVIKDA